MCREPSSTIGSRFQHCLTDGATAAEFEPDGAAAREIAALYDDMMKCLSDGTSTRRAA